MATKKKPNTDSAEAKVNFRYSLGAMQQSGDKAGLAKAKKEHPAEYADWEKRQAKIGAEKKNAPAKKTGKKCPLCPRRAPPVFRSGRARRGLIATQNGVRQI